MGTLWFEEGILLVLSKCCSNTFPQWLVYFIRSNIASYTILVYVLPLFSHCSYIPYEVVIQELLDLLSEGRATHLQRSGQKPILGAEMFGLVVFTDTVI